MAEGGVEPAWASQEISAFDQRLPRTRSTCLTVVAVNSESGSQWLAEITEFLQLNKLSLRMAGTYQQPLHRPRWKFPVHTRRGRNQQGHG
jgi:hypothetical protein